MSLESKSDSPAKVHWWRWIVGALIVLIVLPFVFGRVSGRRQVNELVSRAKERGLPFDLFDLEQLHKRSPEANLAGRELFQMLESLHPVMVSQPEHPATKRYKELETIPFVGDQGFTAFEDEMSEAELQKIQDLLRDFEPYLMPIRQLVRQNEHGFAFPIRITNGPSTLLPHLSQLRKASRWCKLDAHMRALSGDIDGCVNAVSDIFLLSATLKSEPFEVSQSVRISMLQEGVDLLRGALLQAGIRDQLDKPHYERLRAALSDAIPCRAAYQGFLGARALGYFVGDVARADVYSIITQQGTVPNRSRIETIRWGLANGFYRMSGIADRDLAYFLGEMETVINESESLGSKQLAFFNNWQKTALDNDQCRHFYFLSRHLLPVNSGIYQKQIDSIELCRAAYVALAIEMFRNAQAGEMPSSLDELVPDYLDQVPKRLASGGSLELSLVPGGYFIVTDRPIFSVTNSIGIQ